MITYMTDQKEEEKIYWTYIEEVKGFPPILKEYDKLLLIRLKNFIEHQLYSRRAQVIQYLSELTMRDCYEAIETDIKERLTGIKIHDTITTIETYLNKKEIEIVEKEIDYVLKTSLQYCYGYHSLMQIRNKIVDILNPYYFQEKEEPSNDSKSEKGKSNEANIDKKKSTNNKGLSIKDEIIKKLEEDIEPYFDENDQFSKLINGEKINSKLIFDGNKNQLTELFKRIEYNDYFKGSPDKTEIAKWICNNFKPKSKRDFVYNQVYKNELSRSDFSIPKGKRICKSIKFHTKSELCEEKLEN